MIEPDLLTSRFAGDEPAIHSVVRRMLPQDEAVIREIADDGCVVTIHFELVVDPVLLTDRVRQLEGALARAGVVRKVLPMLRLI